MWLKQTVLLKVDHKSVLMTDAKQIFFACVLDRIRKK